MIPVEARCRYITMIAILLGTGTAIYKLNCRKIAPISLDTIGLVVIVV